ncbi:MAG: tetratricopeptide repeat protein [Saprospiraceae bacterium]|nr:tetratricopeptide repeat protein [Saprospiraceae bacterium]
MSRIALVLLCLTFFNIPRSGFAFDVTDSLLHVAQSGMDREAALAYKQLAMQSVDSLDLHLSYSYEGLKIAQQLQDDLLSGNLLMNMGVASDMHGQFDQAIHFYDSALLYLERGNYPDWLSSLYINYGAAYYFHGSNHLALDYWLKAYALCAKDGSDENYPVLLNNIAQIYMELEKYPEAIRYFEEALLVKEAQSSVRRYLNTLRNLGKIYQISGDYDKSIQLLNKARNVTLEINDEEGLQIIDVYLAETFAKNDQIENARELLSPHWKDGFSACRNDLKIEAYIIAGDYFGKTNNLSAALTSFLKANELAMASGVQSDQLSILQGLADIYYKQRNYHQAVIAEREFSRFQKRQIQDNRLAVEQEMQVKFNTLRKEEENAVLREQAILKDALLTKSKKNLWLVILILIAVIGIAIQIYFSRKKVNTLAKSLEDKRQKLRKSLDERELLLKEIHHRVKNNLQFISSLLSLQSRHVQDPLAYEALKTGQDRVRSMALIHQNLYQEDNLAGVPIKTYFEKLTQNLFDSYNISPNRITLNLDVEDFYLDVDTIVPLGLIVNELISNALKHAFPHEDKGEVEMKLKEEKGIIKLEINDNGVGINKDTQVKLGNSFGFRLVNAFKDQLGAEFEINGINGTHIILKITDYQKVA